MSTSDHALISNPFVRALIAGAVAGTSVDLSLYPIDTLKTRLQSSQGFQAAGGFRGVYAGVGSAALGAAPGAAFFFLSYTGTKHILQDRGLSQDSPWTHMLAASVGEVAACAIRVPTEVVKQRAQAKEYNSSLEALQAILIQRSKIGYYGVFRELYRGWSITIMREVPFTIIQFPLWERMKAGRRKTTGLTYDNALESAFFGSLAGAVAAGLTTPLDVLKTRMMLAKDRPKVVPLVMQIAQEGGIGKFFAGIGPRIGWISAGGAIFLGAYEYTSNLLAGA